MSIHSVVKELPIDRMSIPDEAWLDGFWLVEGAVSSSLLAGIDRMFEGLDVSRPGARPHLSLLRSDPSVEIVAKMASTYLGGEARPVRALLLDKHDGANWSLAWHQDRTIQVEERREADGFGPWTVKAGHLHVAPPFEILSRMSTARIHLDAVDAHNAPLLVAPGSHLLGRIAEPEIDLIVERCGVRDCLASRGDVWFYSTPILHASARAKSGSRRRVLQIDFANFDLPSGLEWSA